MPGQPSAPSVRLPGWRSTVTRHGRPDPTRHLAPDLVGVSPQAAIEGPEGLRDAFARFANEG
jgi:hypothetical protein